MKKKGKIIIISGPSQVGKDAVVRKLVRMPELKLHKVITYTTRERRMEEKMGVDHLFIKEEEFKKMIEEDVFLEWAPVRAMFFGTPKDKVREMLDNGENVLLKIDVRGAKQVLEKYPEAVTIFIMPDSLENLRKRMEAKGFSEEQLAIRWQEAMEEIKVAEGYQYRVVNYEGRLNETIESVGKIIKKEIINKEEI
jgi:guanylate kinase